TYLWLQLDENEHKTDAESKRFDESSLGDQVTTSQLRQLIGTDKGLGVTINKVAGRSGNALPYTINNTMMRVELPSPLKPGDKFVLQVDWQYNISDRMTEGGRGGYEYFAEDGNYLYTITQWYPRMAVYSDFEGWQNKQFTGRG